MRTILGLVLATLVLSALGCTGDGDDDSCGSDDNCKGDRICVDGECVDPEGSGGTTGESGAGGSAGESGEGGSGASRVILVRLDDEPPGTNRANGGVAMKSGLDADGSGCASAMCIPSSSIAARSAD
jgi:hypothetical protein